MNYFQLKLIPRLILASLVLVAATLLRSLAQQLYPDVQIFGYLWYSWWAPEFYDIAFAILVLAPFISASRGRWIRVLALIVCTGVVYFAAVVAVVNTQYALERWIDSPNLRFVTMVPTAVVATWLLAFATARIGHLRTSRRYWIYTFIAGFTTGIAFLSIVIIDEYTRSDVAALSDYAPFWLWPVATCASIYYGREN